MQLGLILKLTTSANDLMRLFVHFWHALTCTWMAMNRTFEEKGFAIQLQMVGG